MADPTVPSSFTAPMTTPVNPKRGRGRVIWGVVLIAMSLLLAVGGMVGFFVGVASGTNGLSSVRGFSRVDVPGERSLTLTGGKLDIWVEDSSRIGADTAEVRVEIIDPTDNTALTVTRTSITSSYADNGRHGRLIGSVDVPSTREFIVKTDGSPGTTIALGNLDITGSILGIFGGLIGFFIGLFGGALLFLIGLILLIVGLVVRSNTKRALTGQP